MRPPRLVLLAFCLIFFPIFLTFYSALTSSPRVSTPSSFAGQSTGLHALFSFNLPSSLFPPSAIISLTDENSTFFLARPAAFGPLLPEKGLSGRLWVGSGFGERSPLAGRELGCSDIPGWKEGDSPPESRVGKSAADEGDPGISQGKSHTDTLQGSSLQSGAHLQSLPSYDGTDDHLHHPLPESVVVDLAATEKNRDLAQSLKAAHADIQSLQETAEISGQVVLLSRGGCGFLEKVKWAQRRGALALIVGDDTRGGSLVTMYARGDTSNVTIPAMFTSYTTAHLLSSLIPPQVREELPSTSGTKTIGNYYTDATPVVSPSASPSSTHPAASQSPAEESEPGLFSKVMSVLGLGRGEQAEGSVQGNRRPPSSGNINWVPMDHWDDQETSQKGKINHGSYLGKDSNDANTNPGSTDGDGFVIGVQDWRDPDLVAPKSSAMAVPTGAPVPENANQRYDKGAQFTSTLKGGSITPGSGEYRAVEKSSLSKEQAKEMASHHSSGSSDRVAKSQGGWFSRHFLGARSEGVETVGTKRGITGGILKQNPKVKEHEGLWVTLTPTSMSTSPFFDTLLVLVVSPLLTLSVVYILLLLRSRIRRRRWRAPKSLVERLPVRTYHTMATSSSSSSSSLRTPSPGPVSQTSPLLGSKSSAECARSPRPRYQTVEPRSFDSRREKSGASTFRRKYTGRQVECVVCLEEYIDGQSRVMSLPCGHEFHAECM